LVDNGITHIKGVISLVDSKNFGNSGSLTKPI